MKTKYPSMFGLLAVLMLVASLVVPANVANPAPAQAEPDILRWGMIDTPNSVPVLTKEVLSPSEINKLVVASDGAHMYAIVNNPAFGAPVMYATGTAGWIWSPLISVNLLGAGALQPFWFVAVAPDDPMFVAVVTSSAALVGVPNQVWVSMDGGTTWANTLIGGVIGVGDLISTIDVSPDYGGRRDIAIGTRDGNGTQMNKVWTLVVPGFGNWIDQSNPATGDSAAAWADWVASTMNCTRPGGDVLAVKFSPTYVGDATIAIVGVTANFTNPTAACQGVFWRTGVRDLDQNRTTWNDAIFVSDPSTATIFSGTCNEVVTADLELPSDFSGQAASLRRAYVSIDDGGGTLSSPPWSTAARVTESGIYRVDDTTVYELMDTTSSTFNGTRISSIAYYGTYASGKLLAGEVMADECWVQVPTWFTDSPTTCPIPCWYPAKKPTSGGGVLMNCSDNVGYGNAQVAWSPDGATAYVGTGSARLGALTDAIANPGCPPAITGAPRMHGWPWGYQCVQIRDESAFGLSRNNGETWNQLAMIDTRIDKLTDVAPSADCTTIYLASSNNCTLGAELGLTNPLWLEDNCCGMDSVWRSSSNPSVASPLLPLPIGNVWERVYVRPTALTCNTTQSNYAILRLAPDKEDGQIVFWAAGGAYGGGDVNVLGFRAGWNTRAVAWSPDYGDFWANINPRVSVQDMSAESSTVLYIADNLGMVQRMPYTGTAWSTSIHNGDTGLGQLHTIDSLAEGNVLAGGQDTGNFEASYSADAAAHFVPSAGQLTPTVANNHVEFDTNFADNGIFFMADDDNKFIGSGPTWGGTFGTIYRNTIPFGEFENLLSAPGTAYHQNGYFGMVVAYT